jgi:hypothetical protein
MKMQTSGELRREIAKLYPPVIASAAKQSIAQRGDRLLRCARNDVERAAASKGEDRSNHASLSILR